jgi:tetratricopeptide (TPR) repeat protein
LPLFFGREKELETVDQALDPAARTFVVLINGPGGIGKTTLAIRAAELAKERDYPRIIYASTKEVELDYSGPRQIREFSVSGYFGILNRIARELGNKDFEKIDQKDRSRLLHVLLRENPTLLVLDNLENLSEDDRVRLMEFLQYLPHDTKAIITSRRRTDIQAQIIQLDRMDWPTAKLLLEQLCRNFPLLDRVTVKERKSLYQKTGGNPLILRWTVGQLGRGRCRTIQDALELLKNSPAGDTALEFIFGDLLDAFTAEETNLLGALTYFQEGGTTGDIAAIAELPHRIAQSSLESLADRSLVSGDAESLHFGLTPLVAEFLRRARPEVVNQTGERLANFIYIMASENQKKGEPGFDLLESRWSMIASALPVLISGDNSRLQEFCNAIDDFLSATGRLDECLELNKAAEAKASAAQDFASAGWRAYRVGFIYMLRRQGEQVIESAKRVAEFWLKARLARAEQAFATYLRGLGHTLNSQYRDAIAAFNEALEIYRESRQKGLVLTALNEIGAAKRLIKDYDGAEHDCKEALEIAFEIDNNEGIAACNGNLAKLALDRKDWSEAEQRAVQEFAFSQKQNVNRQDLIAEACLCLAKAYVHQDRLNEARPFARLAQENYKRLRLPEIDQAEELLLQCGR